MNRFHIMQVCFLSLYSCRRLAVAVSRLGIERQDASGKPDVALGQCHAQGSRILPYLCTWHRTMPMPILRLYPSLQGRVVSGHVAALDAVSAAAIKKGALKAAKLAVSGAFHTSLMQPARDALVKV